MSGDVKIHRRKTLEELHEILVAAGRLHKLVLVHYVKVSDDETIEHKTYLVEPYSYRKDKLFAYDVDAKSIKAFTLLMIEDIITQDKHFNPKWPIEFKRPVNK